MKIYPLFKGKFGLEKENIRVNLDGTFSKTKHKDYFIEENPYITRDFAESQIEMITQPKDTVEEAIGELHNIQYVVLESLKKEYLWPQSNPPILPNNDDIQIAEMKNIDQLKYREYLRDRYGKKTTTISGIHFNFSFSNETFKYLNENKPYLKEKYKNDIYLKVAKYFLKNQWLFTYLFAASPIFHKTYKSSCVKNSVITQQGDCGSINLISLRNSECGYKNEGPLLFNYESLENLKKSTEILIETGKIINEAEIYENIRIKTDSHGNISYLELRFIDINPYEFVGVSEEDLQLLHLFAVYFSTLPDFTYSHDQQLSSYQHNIIINNFVSETNELRNSLKIEGLELLNNLKKFAYSVEAPYDLGHKIDYSIKTLKNESYSLSNQVRNDVNKSGYVKFHLDIAKRQKELVTNYPFNLMNYDGLELSTKILLQASIKNGILSSIIDKKDNFILLQDQNGTTQLVKQATKTSLDNYVSVLAMENKVVTKTLLEKENISTPKGITLNSKDTIDYNLLKDMISERVVIKPNSTNFGIGITILNFLYTLEQLEKAVQFAFQFDDNILIEEFIPGLEYRFLVINNQVSAVLHRKAAHVIGNGKDTIHQLINTKNSNPIRGNGYITPLEKIVIDDQLISFIYDQGFTLKSVLKKEELVYLRKTSNISTGGDSIDVTESVDESYKNIALKAAKALGVNITGVDMMISNLNETANPSNHSIIELNFNPAIHIHAYPYVGEKRDIGTIILNSLFY